MTIHKYLRAIPLHAVLLAACLLIIASCVNTVTQQAVQVMVPSEVNLAPVYTATLTVTPSLSPTLTMTPTATSTPTNTNTPTATLTLTSTLTPSHTATFTPTSTDTPTLTYTPSPLPTQELFTLTPVSVFGSPPNANIGAASFSAADGWSCGAFPCGDDIAGHLRRIRVPEGFTLEFVGQLPGQPQQITYGLDGRLYATVLRDDSQIGDIVALDESTGTITTIVTGFMSPRGLAFQPGTDTLYVSARLTAEQGGALYRIPFIGAVPEIVIDDLPCCWREIDNQANGMTFGPDGLLYLGVSSVTDRTESPNPRSQQFAELVEFEASILRIQPHTEEVTVYAQGIRHPFDISFDSQGNAFTTDSGILAGPGDRIIQVREGGHYKWPYWRTYGCVDCPATRVDIAYDSEILRLPDYTLPRGIVAYTGQQFPANYFNDVFVTLWHGASGQRVVRIDPREIPEDPELLAEYTPEPFVTGLMRPIDVIVAPDGALVIADSIYGNVWRVRYGGD